LSNCNKVNDDVNLITEKNAFAVRPWRRFLARGLDWIVFIFLISLLLSAKPQLLNLPDVLYSMFVLFAWVFVEAILLSTIGTTIGKWFFNIELKDIDGGKPSFAKAIKRSFAVWFYGCGAGIGIICVVAMIAAFLDLDKGGVASWDDGNFTLCATPVNDGNSYGKAMMVIVVVGLVLCSMIGSRY